MKDVGTIRNGSKWTFLFGISETHKYLGCCWEEHPFQGKIAGSLQSESMRTEEHVRLLGKYRWRLYTVDFMGALKSWPTPISWARACFPGLQGTSSIKTVQNELTTPSETKSCSKSYTVLTKLWQQLWKYQDDILWYIFLGRFLRFLLAELQRVFTPFRRVCTAILFLLFFGKSGI